MLPGSIATVKRIMQFGYKYKKRGATLMLDPRYKGLRIALLVETEQRRKPHADVM